MGTWPTADLQTKIEELQIIIQSLRENDNVKEEDTLTHLSDQLLVLSERIYTTVRKKINDMIYLLPNLISLI